MVVLLLKPSGGPHPRSIPPFLAGVLGLCAAALLLCTTDTNPFADLTNARAHITGLSFPTLAEQDSLPIYSTQTIDLVVALREEVSQIYLVAPSNRDGDTIRLLPEDDGFGPEVYYLDFSLTDTGEKELSLTTVRSNGEPVSEKIKVRAFSPLRQPPVAGLLRDSITLSTDSVDDPDVWYCWSFGDDALVRSTVHATRAVIPPLTQSAGTGMLWVEGLHDSSSSPRVSFLYSLGDTVPPSISLASGQAGDTLRTGDSVIVLLVKIGDESGIAGVTINGEASPEQSPGVYAYTARGLASHTIAAPLEAVVEARDVSGRTASRSFWIVYDGALPAGPGLAVTFLSPQDNPSFSGRTDKPIIATITDLRAGSLNVRVTVSVNGTQQTSTKVTSANSSGLLTTVASLPVYFNSVLISIADSLHGDTLDTTLSITYAPGSVADTAPPVIADLTVGGQPADGLHSPLDVVNLRIVAFDEGSGIDTLLVNGRRPVPDASARYVWHAPVPLSHHPDSSAVRVYAVDSVRNVPAVRVIRMRHNHAPTVAVGLNTGSYLIAGQPGSWPLQVADADYDSVEVSVVTAPAGLTVGRTAITWTPADSQAGEDSLVLKLWDGCDSTIYSVRLVVMPESNSPPVLYLQGVTGQPLSAVETVYDTTTAFVIVVRIVDPDPPVIDRHQVTITQSGGMSVTAPDSAREFSLTVNARKATWVWDTVRVAAADRGGLSDTAQVVMHRVHYVPPDTSDTTDTSGTRLTLAVGSLDLSGDVVDFPLLVRVSSAMLSALNPTRGPGGLRFTKTDGTELPYEIERWDTAASSAVAWVLVDTIHADLDTQSISVQWTSAPSASSGAVVFDTANGFVGVWHLGAANAQGTHTEVTAHHFNGTSTGGYPSATPLVATGAIGQARQFDGTNDRIDLGDQAAYRTSRHTFSFWVNGTTSPQTATLRKVFCKGAELAEFVWSHTDTRYPQTHLLRTSSNPDAWSGARIPEWLQTNTWYYVCCTYTGSAISVFVNGNPRDTAYTPALTLGAGMLSLGIDPATNGYLFSGLIDEFRFDNVARSDDWIRLCYETQKPGGTVVGFVSGGTVIGPSFTMGDTARYVLTTGEDCILDPNTLYGIRVTLDRSATVESMSTFPGTTGGPVRLGIYDATGTGGQAGALKAQTAEFSITTLAQIERWATTPLVTPVQLPPGTYWLVLLTGANPPTIGCPLTTAGPYLSAHATVTYGPLPETAPAMPSGQWDDTSISLYATLH